MKSVAEHDLRAELPELERAHGLDRSIGAYRHERRRIDAAMRKRKFAGTRESVAVQNLELHWKNVPGWRIALDGLGRMRIAHPGFAGDARVRGAHPAVCDSRRRGCVILLMGFDPQRECAPVPRAAAPADRQ